MDGYLAITDNSHGGFRVSGLHYWTANRNINIFSRFGADVILFEDVGFGIPLFGIGMEYKMKNHSMLLLEVGYITTSITLAF